MHFATDVQVMLKLTKIELKIFSSETAEPI